MTGHAARTKIPPKAPPKALPNRGPDGAPAWNQHADSIMEYTHLPFGMMIYIEPEIE